MVIRVQGSCQVYKAKGVLSDFGLRAGTLVNVKGLKVSLSRACTAQGYRFNTEGRRG